MNTVNKCRICSNLEQEIILSDFRTDRGETYSLVQCSHCSFVSTYPLPSAESLKGYYDYNYWVNAQKKGISPVQILYRLRMRGIVDEIKGLMPPGGRILDWGAGDGALMKLFREKEVDCWGIDLYSKRPEDERLISSSIEDVAFPDEFFDAITCFHVLEHLENLVDSVKKAFSLLKKGGILIIEVPNISSLGFLLFKERWQPLEIPTHLNHFDIRSLQRLFEISGKHEISKISYFSNRVSASSLVLSLFPSLTPRRMRKAKNGRYPGQLMVFYFLLQILALPFAALESSFKKGAVIRVCVTKNMH